MTKIVEAHQNDVLDLSLKRQHLIITDSSSVKRRKSTDTSHSDGLAYKRLTAPTYSNDSTVDNADDENLIVGTDYGFGSYKLDVDDDYEVADDHDNEIQHTPAKRKKKSSIVKFNDYNFIDNTTTTSASTTLGKKQMRFRCKFCPYKSHSVSLIQNHIYRHIDTTPYSCFYCGHKSTTKSTIMVHIELCHPNMDVKIEENRVKEEDYYIDLNQQQNGSCDTSQVYATKLPGKNDSSNKFEIIASKCHFSSEQSINETLDECVADVKTSEQMSNVSSSTTSSCCVSPASSQVQQQQQSDEQQIQNHIQNDESKSPANLYRLIIEFKFYFFNF